MKKIVKCPKPGMLNVMPWCSIPESLDRTGLKPGLDATTKLDLGAMVTKAVNQRWDKNI